MSCLNKLNFGYPREGGHREPDSSGFEHVFVGEVIMQSLS